MRVAIVGGGPAGLYSAIAIKQRLPSSHIKIYEARNESANEFGLGYTLQTLTIDLLNRIDPSALDNMFSTKRPPLMQQSSVRVNDRFETRAFEPGYTVSRYQLIQYLRTKALGLGVKVIHKKIEIKDVSRLKRMNNLLISADGVKSLVRMRYKDAFSAKFHPTKMMFSWFLNESPFDQHQPRFWAVSSDYGVIQMFSYPLLDCRQIVIVEMTKDCYQKAGFGDKTTEEVTAFLNKCLNVSADPISLAQGPLPWVSFGINTVEKLYRGNVALVGESAFSYHYSYGGGLSTAFMMGYILAECLSALPLNEALIKYNAGARLSLADPVRKSRELILWLEGIDEHFKCTPTKELVDHYLLRQNYRTSSKVLSGDS